MPVGTRQKKTPHAAGLGRCVVLVPIFGSGAQFSHISGSRRKSEYGRPACSWLWWLMNG
jgi:hypothetical protein